MARLALFGVLAACGRLGFEPSNAIDLPDSGAHLGSNAPVDGATTDGNPATTDGGNASGAITWVQSPVQHLGSTGASESFTIQAQQAGDAIVIMVTCSGGQVPSGVTLTAPNWTFTPLSPSTLDSPAQIAAASYGAIAPDTAAVSATVDWTSANCNRGKSELADEFAGVDATGGTTTFDAFSANAGTGNCSTSITPPDTGDAVWAGCYVATTIAGPDPGFTAGATDGVGDLTEYKLSSTAGAAETIDMGNPDGFVVVAVTLKPGG